MTDFLESSRALSPSYHLQFGEALSAFALKCVRPVVEAFDGRLIYAGGDDVVALLPADTALRCARALRAAFQGTEELRQLLAGTSAADHFTYPAPGFLAVADHRDDHGRGVPIPFIVPGPAAKVSAGIAIAHFKAPLQDVVRAAQAAEKRAKNKLGRAAVSVRLMKRSGETLDWGAKWAQGGLDLHQALLLALAEGHLTAKFPHRLCEVLAPLVNETTKVTDVEDFPTADLVRSEFARLLRQHEGDNWTPDTGAALTSALDAYLGSLSSHTPTQVFQALIGLATAVAFAHRTAPAPDRQDTHDSRQ
jgi:CRISPR-associated protein Cas10/Cmr2, subtype III-B